MWAQGFAHQGQSQSASKTAQPFSQMLFGAEPIATQAQAQSREKRRDPSFLRNPPQSQSSSSRGGGGSQVKNI